MKPKEIRLDTACTRAIKAMEWVIKKRWEFDANMEEDYSIGTPHAVNAYEQRRLLLESIERLKKEKK